MVGGGAVSKVPVDATAVTPAWRGAVTDMIVDIPVTGAFSDVRVAQKAAHDQMAPIRKLAPVPAGGMYLNEVRSSLSPFF